MKILLPALCLVTTTAFAGPGPAAHALYRLDFELVTTQAGKAAFTTASFSLNLDEHRNAEAKIDDKNVGIKVKASFEMYGTDLLLDVETALASAHRIETRDVALATPGKQAVVASIDHDGVHTQLLVTPTKL